MESNYLTKEYRMLRLQILLSSQNREEKRDWNKRLNKLNIKEMKFICALIKRTKERKDKEHEARLRFMLGVTGV